MFEAIPGQDHVKQMLRRSVVAERPGHAYLFEGAEGLGEAEMARAFVAGLNCVAPAVKRPCGACRACRAVTGGYHPDLHWIEPERAIKIDAVRGLQRELYLRPVEGRYRCAVIERAERLTDQAANALLKLLEEPPDRALLILISGAAESLLPTLRSRCQRVRFRPAKRELLEEWLAATGSPPDEARFLAFWSRGNPGEASRLRGKGTLRETRRDAIDSVRRLAAGDPLDAFAVAEEWEGRRDSELELLRLLSLLFRDLALRQAGASADLLFNTDFADEIEELAALPADFALAARRVEETRRLLDRAVNRRLAFEVLAHGLRRLLAGDIMKPNAGSL